MKAGGTSIVVFGASHSGPLVISRPESVSETSWSSLDGAHVEENVIFDGLECGRSLPILESAHPRSATAGGDAVAIVVEQQIIERPISNYWFTILRLLR